MRHEAPPAIVGRATNDWEAGIAVNLPRRTFLKTAALVAAASALPGCKPQVQKLVPYLLPDDEITPGVADWYASTCGECSAGCGVLVRTMEGRAKKIEGNPDHPINQGKLCARGQAGLQGLYHPDRLQGPLKRDGERGAGRFRSQTWEEAVQSTADELRRASGGLLVISRPLSGTLAWLLQEFVKTVDGELYWYDPAAELPLRTANRLSFGADVLPQYDLAACDLLLSFGAPFLDQWISPVSYGIAYGRMRQERPAVRGRFVHIEPRLSLTAASADKWIPIRPGTEGLMAMGLARVVLAEDAGHLSTNQLASAQFFESVSLDQVARQTDVARDDLVRLGKEVAAARHPLAIGGGTAFAHTNATQSLTAINSLNAVLGHLGEPGSIRFCEPLKYRQSSALSIPWLSERHVETLLRRMESKKRTVLILNDSNPLFAMPSGVPIARLFSLATYILSLGSFLDESAAMADAICPDHSWLESWGDHVAEGGPPVQTVSLRQPVVRPLYNTRQVGDTVLDIARVLEPRRFPWDSFPTLLQHRWRTEFKHGSREGFEPFWLTQLQQGGWWDAPSKLMPVRDSRKTLSMDEAQFFGEERDFPFYLYLYPSMSLGYNGAHLPWLQELPDTLTTAMWGMWIEVNPATARQHGIAQGDIVRITSIVGSIEAPALLFPGIRPDVIAVPIGQGHTSFGRYASGRGVNPLSLIVAGFDPDSGAVATCATRVRIERTGRKGRIVLAEQPAVDASDLIQVDRVKPS